MTKIYTYIIIIFVLILILMLGVQNHKKTTSIRDDKRDFALTDTLSIDQLILQNKNLEKITLQRNTKKNQWQLNDSLIANQYLIDLLLKTLKEMTIKQPVARSALKNVIQRMSIQHTKVDIFQNKKKIKTIYIGGETQDQLGTFMMIEGAKEPYIIHIPGFNGYLSSRFSCKEYLWINKRIFPKEIDKAIIILNKNNQLIQKPITNHADLTTINCERFLVQNQFFNPKSIMTRKPFGKIEITSSAGITTTLYCIRKKAVNKEKYKKDKYDKERFYGLMNNQVMLIQYKQFEKIIISESITDYFTPWKKLNSNSLK